MSPTDTNAIKILSFDCYGTLIDWDKGVKEFFKEILLDKNKKLINGIISRWEAVQFQLIQKEFLPYEELQNKCFAQTFTEYHITTSANFGRKLLENIPHWKPFSDVYSNLSLLKNYYKLVLISNGPLSVLEKNAKKMGISFDKIISAELVKAYKPNKNIFRYALEQLKKSSSEIIHIAAGYKYDVIPAKTLGIKTVWVNRKRITLPEKILPDYDISNLYSLPRILNL